MSLISSDLSALRLINTCKAKPLLMEGPDAGIEAGSRRKMGFACAGPGLAYKADLSKI